MKRFVAVIATFCILLSSVARGEGELSREEWRDLFKGRVQWTIDFYYSFLGKAYNDSALTIARTIQTDLVLLYVLQSRLNADRARLLGSAADKAAALRDVQMVKSQADFLGQNITYYQELWERLKKLRLNQCGVTALGTFAREFSISANLEVKNILDQMNKQIEELMNRKDLDTYSFSVEFGHSFGGGSRFQIGGSSGTGSTGDAIVGASTLIGAGIGAVCGGVGAFIGAPIGYLVGSIIAGIIGETPRVKWVRVYREQESYVLDAVGMLGVQGPLPMATAACGTYVGSPELGEMFKQVESDVERSRQELMDLRSQLEKGYLAVRASYEAELSRLQAEILPLVREVIADRFEDYFKQVEKLSGESRDYAASKVAPVLRRFLSIQSATDTQVETEESLWDSLIEGEARYSRGTSFAFAAAKASAVPEVIYWDAAVEGILKRLESGPKGASLPREGTERRQP